MTEEIDRPQEETLDDLGRKGLRMIQSKNGFRFGEDTVILAYFSACVAPLRKKGTRALELGVGCGAASLLLSGRRPDMTIDGIEMDKGSFEIFQRNIRLNDLSDRLRPFHGDIRDFPFGNTLSGSSYDFVFFNPPYRDPKRGPITNKDVNSEALLNARFEKHGGIADFIATTGSALRPGGIVALVHRAGRMPEVFSAMNRSGIEPTKLRIIYPDEKSPATAFLLAGRKGGKPGGFSVGEPLIIRTSDMQLSEEVKKIYSSEG